MNDLGDDDSILKRGKSEGLRLSPFLGQEIVISPNDNESGKTERAAELFLLLRVQDVFRHRKEHGFFFHEMIR